MSVKRAVTNVAIAQDVLEQIHERAIGTVQLAAARSSYKNASRPRWTGNASFLADAQGGDPRCTAHHDDVLRKFMESSVVYTPQHANLTRIVRAAARHVDAMTHCQLALARTLARFWECAGVAWNVVVDGALAVVGWENAVRDLEGAMHADRHAARPEPWKLADTIAGVSTAAVSALARTPSAEMVMAGIRVHENQTDAAVARRWLDTLCCAFVAPAPLVDADFVGCTPAHHSGPV
jgi:hypothetical protein